MLYSIFFSRFIDFFNAWRFYFDLWHIDTRTRHKQKTQLANVKQYKNVHTPTGNGSSMPIYLMSVRFFYFGCSKNIGMPKRINYAQTRCMWENVFDTMLKQLSQIDSLRRLLPLLYLLLYICTVFTDISDDIRLCSSRMLIFTWLSFGDLCVFFFAHNFNFKTDLIL